jgi:hypothetical protein
MNSKHSHVTAQVTPSMDNNWYISDMMEIMNCFFYPYVGWYVLICSKGLCPRMAKIVWLSKTVISPGLCIFVQCLKFEKWVRPNGEVCYYCLWLDEIFTDKGVIVAFDQFS